MSIVTMVSRRFLTGKKRNTFLSFIAAVSLFGVCLGVAALTIVMSVMEGFESELQSIVTGAHSHIVLYSNRQLINNRFELEDRVKEMGEGQILAISPYIFSEVMLAKGSRVVGSLIEGIEEDSAKKTTRIMRHLVLGEMPETSFDERPPTILLGSALAENLSAKLGDEVMVISPVVDKNGMQPRSRKFKVGGILSTGMYEYDSKYSLIHINEARDFFKLPETAASAFKIITKDANNSYLVSTRLQKELGYPYRARDWTELNRNLLYAIRLQKAVLFIILTAIIIVAAFNIMSTLMMMMSEKKKEMSILKAMGLSPRKSAKIFMSVGLLIGLSGAVAGICIGLLLCFILSKTRFVHLPADIYFISYLPIDVRPITLLLISICAILVAFMATIYPSLRVAAESPVEGLRYE